MAGSKIRGRQRFISRLLIAACMAATLIAAGCGDEASRQESADQNVQAAVQPGSAAFSVQWHTPEGSRSVAGALERMAIEDCNSVGVVSITCDVYDDSDNFIATGGPWSCEAHRGSIEHIAAGPGRRFAVLGWNAADGGGDIVYHGQIAGITIAPGVMTDAGTIDAYGFVPTGFAAEGVSSSRIDLAWTMSAEVTGILAGYHIYRGGSLHATVTDTIYSDANGLSATTQYCYTVSAFDIFGNESGQTNDTCASTTDNAEPVARITAPADNTIISRQSSIAFTGTGEDPEEGTLTGAALVWTSSIDGRIGSGESVSSLLTEADHTITLTATDSQGASGRDMKRVLVDYTPPSTPGNIHRTGISASQIDLAWDASSDNVALAGYRIYRDDTRVGTSASAIYRDSGLKQNTRYCYTVEAYDGAGLASVRSQPALCLTTLLSRTWYRDGDGDGYGDPSSRPIDSVSQPQGYVTDHSDCRDDNRLVHPGAPEICNGIDDDCDQSVDEGVQGTYYLDSDGDRYGDVNHPIQACTQPPTYVDNSADCQDQDISVHPGATETCNGIDDDCDQSVDEGVQNTYYLDFDGDRYGDINKPVQACTAPQYYVDNNTDCQDRNVSVHPGATEICNGIDDDCDQSIDEGVQNTYYLDFDGDHYGDINSPIQACALPEGHADNSTDCQDRNASIHPGANELCGDLVDNDCDAGIDEGCAIGVDIDTDFKYVDQGWPLGLAVGQTTAAPLRDSPYEKLFEPSYYKIFGEFYSIRYGYLKMGNSQDDLISIVVVVAPVIGADAVYYTFFVDRNNNEDLTDDGGPFTNQGTGRLATLVSLQVDTVTDSGNTIIRPYHLWIWLDDNDNVRFYTQCHYTGEIVIGADRFTAVAYEYDKHDALYRESGLYIDLDKNGVLDRDTENFMDQAWITIHGRDYQVLLNYP